uniref:30S ribosomal protein S1 n=1 Tax=Scytothamnus australis TaxID=66621 RepID=UPI002E7699DA|nr:30S ribosomal protein S1 [Scytothamnus australis]WAM64804.1 30S ribosomal protein S1 [Scytothamnus australis]
MLTSKFDFNKFGLILSKYSYQVKKNDILAGVIVGIESNYVLVDLGLKEICFLPLNELSVYYISDPRELLYINFIGEFLINSTSGNRIIVSLKKVHYTYLWNRLRQIDFKNLTIYGKVEKSFRRGKIIIYNDLFFFTLNSSMPKYYHRSTNKSLFLPFKFIEVKDSFHIAHISSKLAIFSKLNKNLTIGERYVGNIVSIRDFGILVNILGIKCLFHISKVPKEQNLTSFYSRGDQIEFKIISKDIERGKISLSLEK